jgi:hypothetical protein
LSLIPKWRAALALVLECFGNRQKGNFFSREGTSRVRSGQHPYRTGDGHFPHLFLFPLEPFTFREQCEQQSSRGNCATGLAVALRSSLPRSTPQQHSRHPTRTRNSQLADASHCLGFLSPSLAQIGAHRCLPYRSSLRARPAMVMERTLVRLLRSQALRAASSSALVQVRPPLPPSQLIDGFGRSRVAR